MGSEVFMSEYVNTIEKGEHHIYFFQLQSSCRFQLCVCAG